MHLMPEIKCPYVKTNFIHLRWPIRFCMSTVRRDREFAILLVSYLHAVVLEENGVISSASRNVAVVLSLF